MPEVRLGPDLEIIRDYDGYFEQIALRLIADHQGPFRSSKVTVNAGPYRPYAVAYEWDEESKTMHLDFYSALRRGFGSLGDAEHIGRAHV